jgi:hypothetical protein
MKGGCAGIHGDRMFRANDAGKLRFEFVHLGPQGGDPAGVPGRF